MVTNAFHPTKRLTVYKNVIVLLKDLSLHFTVAWLDSHICLNMKTKNNKI